jgi:hypothetical protein
VDTKAAIRFLFDCFVLIFDMRCFVKIDHEPGVQWAKSRDNILMFSVPVSQIVGRMPVPRSWVRTLLKHCLLNPLRLKPISGYSLYKG